MSCRLAQYILYQVILCFTFISKKLICLFRFLSIFQLSEDTVGSRRNPPPWRLWSSMSKRTISYINQELTSIAIRIKEKYKVLLKQGTHLGWGIYRSVPCGIDTSSSLQGWCKGCPKVGFPELTEPGLVVPWDVTVGDVAAARSGPEYLSLVAFPRSKTIWPKKFSLVTLFELFGIFFKNNK